MEEKKKKQVRGIRISTVNMIMIFISCALYVLLITATVRDIRMYTVQWTTILPLRKMRHS